MSIKFSVYVTIILSARDAWRVSQGRKYVGSISADRGPRTDHWKKMAVNFAQDTPVISLAERLDVVLLQILESIVHGSHVLLAHGANRIWLRAFFHAVRDVLTW